MFINISKTVYLFTRGTVRIYIWPIYKCNKLTYSIMLERPQKKPQDFDGNQDLSILGYGIVEFNVPLDTV